MPVGMMDIGHMGVRMPYRRVMVRMTVWLLVHGFMVVAMVAVIMAVLVLMREFVVRVLMFMRLRQVHNNTEQHEQATDSHAPVHRAVAEQER